MCQTRFLINQQQVSSYSLFKEFERIGNFEPDIGSKRKYDNLKSENKY